MVHYEKDFGGGKRQGAASTTIADVDRTHSASGWFDWLYRLFGHREEAIIGTLAVLFATTVGTFVIKDAYFSTFKDKTGVQRIIANRWNDRTLVFPIEGFDAAGRRALFDVVVLTKNYGWVLGSTTELERGTDRLSPKEIEEEVLAPQLREGLGSAHELIAVGVASQEGELEREIQRGGLRAARIAHWVRGALGEKIPMWTLNLGRYLEPCTDCETEETSWQRPFIVIAVRQAEAGVNIGEALNNAMRDKENLPSPDRYSTFALAKFVK
jgi:hypothetical protein